MILTNAIEYHSAPYGFIAKIPKGTKLDPADNLPQENGVKKYWARAWPAMQKKARSWHENYGFLIEAREVKKTVKMLVFS